MHELIINYNLWSIKSAHKLKLKVKTILPKLTCKRNSPSKTYPTTGPGWVCGSDPMSPGGMVRWTIVATTFGPGVVSGCCNTTCNSVLPGSAGLLLLAKEWSKVRREKTLKILRADITVVWAVDWKAAREFVIVKTSQMKEQRGIANKILPEQIS